MTAAVIPDLTDFSPEQQEALLQAAKHELWRRGDLRHLLDSNQLAIHEQIFGCAQLQFVIEASRKIGKSYLLCVIAFEAALRNPGGRVNYVAPTAKECAEITQPIMTEIAALAPADCRPEWKAASGHWLFPNGAIVVLGGADDQAAAERMRGPSAILNIVDEAGFVGVLAYLLDSILAPQTMLTGGRTILGSTPPFSPGHSFCELADAALAQGAYAHRDIYSHARMTREQIDAYLSQRAAARNMTLEQYRQTSDYQREYMARRVLDSDLAVIPEFALVRDQVVVEQERPPHLGAITIAIDPGMSDATGIVAGYYDFRAALAVIEHEILLDHANTQTIATEIQRLITGNYVGLRTNIVIDDPHGRMVADLWGYHRISAAPARKDDREAGINALRVEIGGKKVLIHPRCTNLIRQLATAVRKSIGGDMARSARDKHFDLVAALLYWNRSLDRFTNPYPRDFGFDRHKQARREPIRGQGPATFSEYLKTLKR